MSLLIPRTSSTYAKVAGNEFPKGLEAAISMDDPVLARVPVTTVHPVALTFAEAVHEPALG